MAAARPSNIRCFGLRASRSWRFPLAEIRIPIVKRHGRGQNESGSIPPLLLVR